MSPTPQLICGGHTNVATIGFILACMAGGPQNRASLGNRPPAMQASFIYASQMHYPVPVFRSVVCTLFFSWFRFDLKWEKLTLIIKSSMTHFSSKSL
jgi:hypothetical protein